METMTVRRGWNDDRIDGLELKVDEGFRNVAERFKRVDERFDLIDMRFEQIDNRLGRLEVGMESLRRLLVMFCVGMAGCFATMFTTLLVAVLTQL
jgi:hypothetical protein